MDIWIVFFVLSNTNRVAVNIYRFLCKLKFSILWEKFPISRVWLFVTPWTVACQATLSISNSWIYSISCPLSRWCHPTTSSSVIHFSHLQSFPASGFFPMSQFFASGGQKYWSFSFNISPSIEYSGLVYFRMDWLELLAVQWTLKSLLPHHSSKALIFRCSAFFIVPLSHPYVTTGKTIALTRWIFVFM